MQDLKPDLKYILRIDLCLKFENKLIKNLNAIRVLKHI